MESNTLEFLQKLEDFFSHPDFTDALREFFTAQVQLIEFLPLDEEQPLR